MTIAATMVSGLNGSIAVMLWVLPSMYDTVCQIIGASTMTNDTTEYVHAATAMKPITARITRPSLVLFNR